MEEVVKKAIVYNTKKGKKEKKKKDEEKKKEKEKEKKERIEYSQSQYQGISEDTFCIDICV